MPKQDFLMRLLEQLQGVIPYILDLTKTGDYEEAHAVVDQAVRAVAGVSTSGLVRLSDQEILDGLRRDQTLDWDEKAFFIAVLLKEDAAVYEKQEDEPRSFRRNLKALHLFIWLFLETEDGAEHTAVIRELLDKLDDYILPGQSYALILRYHEAAGDYAQAENALFEWQENEAEMFDSDAPSSAEAGAAFYERILQKSDEELEAGNLPRAEAEAGLADLLDGIG
ncbi:MAG: hypothetical protein HF973_10265 [Chloroflexi bacterium]|nr:hypothetical protein [Chloroflexota bacterium]